MPNLALACEHLANAIASMGVGNRDVYASLRLARAAIRDGAIVIEQAATDSKDAAVVEASEEALPTPPPTRTPRGRSKK